MKTNDILLQSIKTLIQQEIEKAPFNKTKQGIITKNYMDGTYDVRFDGNLYTKILTYPNSTSLQLGQTVKIIIPNNQSSQMYISAEGSPLIYYPVGSYYETSDTSFDPNVTWGGTWISETILDDEIVEEGTSGIWTYRKWSDGVYEVWGKTTNSCAMTTAYGSTYYGSVNISIAGLGFVEIKDMQITGQASGAYFATKIDNLTANTLALSCRASNSNTASVTHYVRITGTWKTYTAPNETYRWHRTA